MSQASAIAAEVFMSNAGEVGCTPKCSAKRSGVSRRKMMMKMRPRSEKDSCSENQIRFSQNRFRFRQNVLLDHPLCERAVMRTGQTSLQSSRLEFFAIPRQHDNTLAYRLLM
jgi:hypothetical protein